MRERERESTEEIFVQNDVASAKPKLWRALKTSFRAVNPTFELVQSSLIPARVNRVLRTASGRVTERGRSPLSSSRRHRPSSEHLISLFHRKMSFTMAPASSLLSSRSAVSVRGSRAAQVQGARRPSLARSQNRSGRVTGAPLSVRAVVMDPGEQSKPRTEAIQNNTNPWSAESAVPVNKKARGEPVRIKIDAQWYDARGWALAHPGGERWIHFFDGRDATDVFYALHSYGPNGSSKAVDRLAKLPKCDAPPPKELKKPTPSEYATSMSFRDFRGKLEKDGFFERNVFKEAWALVSVLGLYVSGQYFAYSNPCVVRTLPPAPHARPFLTIDRGASEGE